MSERDSSTAAPSESIELVTDAASLSDRTEQSQVDDSEALLATALGWMPGITAMAAASHGRDGSALAVLQGHGIIERVVAMMAEVRRGSPHRAAHKKALAIALRVLHGRGDGDEEAAAYLGLTAEGVVSMTLGREVAFDDDYFHAEAMRLATRGTGAVAMVRALFGGMYPERAVKLTDESVLRLTQAWSAFATATGRKPEVWQTVAKVWKADMNGIVKPDNLKSRASKMRLRSSMHDSGILPEISR